MKVALVCYSDQGGAGIACRRLHDALRINTPWEITTVVRSKQRLHAGVRSAMRPLDSFSDWLGDGLNLVRRKFMPPPPSGLVRNRHDDGFALKVINSVNPDIVNLHWLGEKFLSTTGISFISQPIVWTLHDMWAFTGGCYYSGSCDHFERGCGSCPLLPDSHSHDFTAADFQRKRKVFSAKNLTIVTPSKWLASEAKKSPLLEGCPIEVIPNSVDTELFRPLPQAAAREIFGLPADKTLLLFGSLGGTRDPRKGFDLLKTALTHLSKNQSLHDMELVVFGLHFDACDLPLPVHFVGELYDERSMALLYSAADLLVIPSRQDNLPNTALEALSCGLPCVAFPVGGLTDIVRDGVNGRLAQALTGESLASAIDSLLSSPSGLSSLRQSARLDAVTRYAPAVQATAYQNLFQRLSPQGSS